ncbi:AzlC family ABC transporter permease [Dictyobacter arantiisoli]|uniref:Branched-chain amino acid ABC transporter permease n=1 Tax=Dictyobacter arantiisoli TaxID=2014874 RepID=A0A5A5THX2_9CHLR|nr:AzlC family ABC transporter permease [Dictyobacter arantiisoli]GCF10653.1 branched-chain amino acid ABC transporter permease [Dictyobacter arantiisoli]
MDTTLKRSAFLNGIKDELPILLGTMPFGLIYGVIAHQSGLSRALAQAASAIVFAGSAQLVMSQFIGASVPILIIILTVFVINVRHVLYSASLAPHMKQFHPFWKYLLAYFLTDEVYAVVITHFTQQPQAQHKQWYFFGAGLTLWSTWQISTLAGLLLGAQIPASWSLDFTLPLTFTALVVPALRDHAGLAAALVAGIVAILALSAPLKLGIVLATVLGICAGMGVEALLPARPKQTTSIATTQNEAPTVQSSVINSQEEA